MESKLLSASISSSPFPLMDSSKASLHLPTCRACFSFIPISCFAEKRSLSLKALATSTGFVPAQKRVDGSEKLTLENIRHSLILQEDSIIFSLLERALYLYNADTYDPDVFSMDGFHGSLVEYMIRETEKLHAKVGRYRSPDEHPFFPDSLPESLLLPLHYPQALSKRIHYGKFVAEAKFQASPDAYKAAIIAQDKDKLMDMLTYAEV